MNKPLVSVIVPVKNGERFLASAINSVLEQDYRPLEIIVVDGPSIDSTAKIAKSFSSSLGSIFVIITFFTYKKLNFLGKF